MRSSATAAPAPERRGGAGGRALMRERRGTVGGAATHASLRVPGSTCVPIGLRRDEGGAGATLSGRF